MKPPELYNALSLVERAARQSQGAPVVRFYNGKAQYMANGFFVEQDNYYTHQLPDFGLSVRDLMVVADWRAVIRDSPMVSVTTRNKEVVFSATTGVGLSQLVLPQAPTDLYEGIEEVVLIPRLTFPYSFEVEQQEVERIAKALAIVYNEVGHNTFNLSVSDPEISFKVHSSQGSVTNTIMTHSEDSLPSGDWQNNYGLAGLALQPDYLRTTNPMLAIIPTEKKVKFSFNIDQNKRRSPLSLEYENGVTVVLSPLHF